MPASSCVFAATFLSAAWRFGMAVVVKPTSQYRGTLTQEMLPIDTSGSGRFFDGIGAISGGGATSRLLVDYPPEEKTMILDFLFKPNFGASLQMLKVEIGGDAPSTNGVEPSHMHSAEDLSFERGYEWWLMKEAKRRNPQIKLYGLPWSFPGWIGEGSSLYPYSDDRSRANLVDYILKWVQGAVDVHGLTIDYLGIWNEREADAAYVKELRKTLDEKGFNHIVLVANDNEGNFCDELAKNPDVAQAIGVIGLHYPDDFENRASCRGLGFGGIGGKPIWSSEESSSFADQRGAACWARAMSSHWVYQGMTSSMMWNLVGSYLHGTSWYGSSMLIANEPFSGAFHSLDPVWATAHVTQFTRIGWKVLSVGSGSGELPGGGFYVTYADTESENWTLTVVKMSREYSQCARPELPEFVVQPETVSFRLSSAMRNDAPLAVWYSNFEPQGDSKDTFKRLPDIHATDGVITLELSIGSFYTVSTIVDGPSKGEAPESHSEQGHSWPLPLDDDFESYSEFQEAKWWSDQLGSFEIHRVASGNSVMRQMVPQKPIDWIDALDKGKGPVTVVGMTEWRDLKIAIDFALPEGSSDRSAGCVGTRLDQFWTTGIVLCVFASGRYTLSVGAPNVVDHLGEGVDSSEVLTSGAIKPLERGRFYRVALMTILDKASAFFQDTPLFTDVHIRSIDSGFAGIGANDWIAVEFDNVNVEQAGPFWSAPSACHEAQPGTPLSARSCTPNGVPDESQTFALFPNGNVKHLPSGLCASQVQANSSLVMVQCDATDMSQVFDFDHNLIRNGPQPMYARAAGSSGDRHILGSFDGWVTIGAKEFDWNTWAYFPTSKQLRNKLVAYDPAMDPMCLSVC
eukprot:TRINITY_DN1997_c0_g1_i3.p1 TRINITY_DN1997_c0_g1~~TRINITY_DN1997_c0_g1_i3.p1  ORF type:complete len:867 (-),score=85.44 TRINITY_DN1997_c0_g1_i3:169-2733(-)